LPGRTLFFHGRNFPQYDWRGNPIVASTLRDRIGRKLAARLPGLSKDPIEQRAFKRRLQRHQVTAVLAEYGQVGVAVSGVCAQLDLPLIVHFHGWDAYDNRILTQAGQHYPQLFRQAAAIVAVSRAMRQQLLELGAPASKLHYNPYGVNCRLFQPASPGRNPPTFVAVGRLVDKKAPHLTLLAFKAVADEVPEARLQIIGDGYLQESCHQLVRALGLSQQVALLGVREPQAVAAAMQNARAFVQHSVRTSYGDSEGTPVAVLEAGAAGLPAVATQHAGIADVVQDGQTGYLVAEGDTHAMGQRLLQLAQSPALADRLGQAARARIEAHFSMEASLERLWQIVESAPSRAASQATTRE